MVSNVEGYHQYIRGRSVRWSDIISTMDDNCVGIPPVLWRGDGSRSVFGFLDSTEYPPHCWWYFPQYWWYRSTVLIVSTTSLDILQSNNGIPNSTDDILHCIELPLKYWTSSIVVHILSPGWEYPQHTRHGGVGKVIWSLHPGSKGREFESTFRPDLSHEVREENSLAPSDSRQNIKCLQRGVVTPRGMTKIAPLNYTYSMGPKYTHMHLSSRPLMLCT